MYIFSVLNFSLNEIGREGVKHGAFLAVITQLYKCCVRVCMIACVHACVHTCLHVCMRASMRDRVCVCV